MSATASIIMGILGVGGQLLSAKMQGDANTQAGLMSLRATREAQDEARKMYQQERADNLMTKRMNWYWTKKQSKDQKIQNTLNEASAPSYAGRLWRQ